ncbi:MAG: NAD(P)/FAD-dependent oxidoreductase [Oscillospiraceae bacterium]|nr:NAD(P)/FAD-dependent oxidoreductase [Oscillospiraceae bacterium]
MSTKFKHVFEPIEIRGIYYKNRLQFAPPGCGGAGDENGFVTPRFVEYFRPYARGGAAVVNVGNVSIDLTECNDEGGQLDMRFDACIPPLSTFASMCKLYGAHGQLEINHCGATQGNMQGAIAGEQGIAPSALITAAERVRAKLQGRDPLPLREMSKAKIEETVQKYANAALRAKKAGMDTVLFHGAHGNMLAQFFSTYFNRREDEYGGSAHNRARFAMEVLDATRQAVGEDFVIEYRISADEYREGRMHFKDTLEFIDIVKDKVDIFHVSGGLHDTQGEPLVMGPMHLPYTYPEMYNVHWAGEIKKAFPGIRLTTVGAIKNIEQAEEIISSGTADFVAYMRALIADPDMPHKYAEGREYDHRPCIRCACFYADKYGNFDFHRCSVNPIRGIEEKFPENRVPLAAEKKKMAVIGGGPAGIQAMQTLVERGHDVTLYEKEAEIGGNLRNAVLDPRKTDVKQYLTYLQNQAVHTKAKVLLNTEAKPEDLKKEGYDAILVAVGAQPIKPNIPGIDKAHVSWAPDAEKEGAKVGKKLVIIGGGAVGVQTAVRFAMEGKSVTLVEIEKDLNLGGSVSMLIGGAMNLRQELVDYNVDVLLCHKVEKIDDKAVTVKDLSTGESKKINADTVLYCVGMKGLDKEAQAFRSAAPNTRVYLVGDCYDQLEIRGAVHSAFAIASIL